LSYADGLAVAKRVDGVLVVCDMQQVRRDDLDRVWELITGAGGRILGAVLDKGTRGGRLGRLLDGGPSHRKSRRGRSRSSADDRGPVPGQQGAYRPEAYTAPHRGYASSAES